MGQVAKWPKARLGPDVGSGQVIERISVNHRAINPGCGSWSFIDRTFFSRSGLVGVHGRGSNLINPALASSEFGPAPLIDRIAIKS